MTNATVGTVTEAPQGKVVHVKFKDGESEYSIGSDVPILAPVPGDKSLLKPGAAVFPRRPEGRGRQRDGEFHVRREGRHQAADVTEVRDGSRMPWDVIRPMTVIGASRPLRPTPAIVSFLNPQMVYRGGLTSSRQS
jgi:hypothetical protein